MTAEMSGGRRPGAFGSDPGRKPFACGRELRRDCDTAIRRPPFSSPREAETSETYVSLLSPFRPGSQRPLVAAAGLGTSGRRGSRQAAKALRGLKRDPRDWAKRRLG
jgi:hypothetical protein